MKQLILTFAFSFLLIQVHASYFRNYQVENGLSHNSVWAVMQDHKGFLWFGTNDGLNRFDGKTFKIFRKKQDDSLSIGNNFIHCLKEDSQKRFLVGTKEGLYLYDDDKESFSEIYLSENKKPASINVIMEDPDGNLWIGCNGQGLYILDPELKVKKHYINAGKKNDIPSNFIWNIEKDYSGGIWIGSVGAGLIHFDSKKEIFSKISENPKIGITNSTVFSIYCDIDNNIWVGTLSEGLYCYNLRSGKVSRYMKDIAFNIKSITEYSDHELIMGSDKGLIRFNRLTENFELINEDATFDNLTDKSIFSIIRDNEGSFWIGTYFGGVNYFSPLINKFAYFGSSANSSLKSITSSFAEDLNGNIWVGTYNYGLSSLNPRNRHLNTAKYSIGYHDIQALLLDGDELYISLYGKGISILDINTGNVRKLPYDLNTITSMFKASDGRIIFGSEEGANYIDSPSGSFKRIDRLTGVPVKGIAEDYNGNLWFACHAKGLMRLSSTGNWTTFKHNYNDKNSLVVDNVNCVFQDSKFRIWIGTEGGGLTLFNHKQDSFDLILDESSGLPSNIIYAILEDADGNIWVTTGGGLVKIDADLTTIKTFGYINDLQRIRYNLRCALRASDNRLYFGGTNGFIAFNPKEITTNLRKPDIIITGFRISNKEIVPGMSSPLRHSVSNTKEIVLDHNQSTFSFDFASLSFLSPSDNQYAYMLEGFDSDWNNIGNGNKAHYMNIPPGEYSFKVKATNNDGVWSDIASISVKINPPIWLTKFMIVLYILLFSALCTILIRSYNKRIARINKEKIYKYKNKKEKEIYESKINFFTNIAHEIRTPLSLIVAPLENIIISEDGNNRTKNNLNIIKQNTNRLLELINQLLDFRKIEDDMFHFNFKQQDIVKIVRDIYNQYNQNARLNNIDIRLHIDEEPIICVADTEAIYKIVSNLFSNAIKYAQKNIDIDVRIKDNRLLISVRDDGPGIEKVNQSKIFEPFFQVQNDDQQLRTGSGLGLPLSQSLAEKHGGKLSVESEYGSGSTFILNIPVRKTSDEDLPKEESAAEEEKNTLSENHENTESGLKILIVEDNNELREFLADSLKESYTVFKAENGKIALDIIDKENIDVIISDIIMPELDGLELCNIVKSNTAFSHIPLILLSAKTDTPTKIEGLKKGADVYLEKPFSTEQLKAQINSIIENRNNIRNNFIQSPLQYFKQNKENNENADFIEKLNAIIIENMSDEKFSIDNLSEKFFISRSNFHKKIKNITGMTPNDYIKLIRLNRSAQLLSTGKYKINEVCYLVGFNTPSYFSKCFLEQFGKLPKDFMQDVTE